MMAHVAPTEYNFHGREGPSYNPAADYYTSGLQLHPDPAAIYRHPPPPPPNYHHQHHPPPPPAHRNLSDNASALADALAGMELPGRAPPNPAPNKELVVQAIEAASSVLRDQASALREQISENERLRSMLKFSEWELQNYRIDQGVKSRLPENDDVQAIPHLLQSRPTTPGVMQNSNAGPFYRDPWTANDFLADPNSSLIVHPNAQSLLDNSRYPSNGFMQGQQYGVNGGVKSRNLPDGGISQTSSPSITGREGESDVRTQPGSQGDMQQYQDLGKLQEEIQQLRKLLSDAKLKEMQLVHENRLFQTRIHELRLNVTKYQQDLIKRAPSTDILDENARLTSEIRAAHQDNHFYSSSLMSLLADFNLQPATNDPHSIVSGVKALVQRLREDFQGRKDSLQQWRGPPVYQQTTHVSSPSPLHPMSRAPPSPEPHGLELVPTYPQAEIPLSPTSPLSRTPRGEWESASPGTYENDNGRRSGYPRQASEPPNSSTFHDEDPNPAGHHYAPDYPDKDRLSPPLPTLPEEGPTSSDEDDPLPDIEGLCINGEAMLGNKITACGISINGTTLCHFQWVRHHRDGSFFHIPGAAQPEYTITADDIDTVLSLECTPMDDRNRKGEMVQVYVNNRNWITLEAEMQEEITEYLGAGQATFDVKLGIDNTQDVSFEPATLMLKRSGYELKRSIGKRVVATERYADSVVEIKVGKDAQCAIISNGGTIYILDCESNRLRDMVVLTMREFIKQAIERKKGKKRVSLWK